MKLNAALLQTDLAFGKLEQNLQKLEGLIRGAVEKGANLICLPESCNIGYRDSEIRRMAEEMSEPMGGVTLTRMKNLALELRVYLVVPLFLRVSGGCENAAVLISDTGEPVGSYAKTHLTASERNWLRAGNDYPVFDTRYGKLGMLICNDVGWPEVARLLAIQGAEILVLPSAWAYFKEVPFWWSAIVRARAMENAVLVAAVNRVGQAWDDGTPFCGESTFIDPSGAIKGAMSGTEDGILLQELPLDELRAAKKTYGYMVAGRKPQDYGPLCK